MKKNKLKSLSEKRRENKFGEWKTTTFGSGGQGKEVYFSWPKKKSVDKFFSWLISKVPGSRAPWDFKDRDSDGEHDDFEKPEDDCQCRKKKS